MQYNSVIGLSKETKDPICAAAEKDVNEFLLLLGL
jgi:hypothetical protein